jgi:hypothetical protein
MKMFVNTLVLLERIGLGQYLPMKAIVAAIAEGRGPLRQVDAERLVASFNVSADSARPRLLSPMARKPG